MQIALALLIFIFVELATVAVVLWVRHRRQQRTTSFKKAYKSAAMPFMTFAHGERQLNFLLDTGSSNSVVNQAALEGLDYTKSESKCRIMGMEGNPALVDMIFLDLHDKHATYTEEFQVVDMTKAFSEFQQSTGVEIHGVLGNTFFVKYKMKLDYGRFTMQFK